MSSRREVGAVVRDQGLRAVPVIREGGAHTQAAGTDV